MTNEVLCFFFPITIIPVKINKNIKEDDNISELILEAVYLNNLQICENDVIVVAQKIVSKSENRILNLKDVTPSKKALEIFSIHEKDPRLIELILRESLDIIRVTNKNLIV